METIPKYCENPHILLSLGHKELNKNIRCYFNSVNKVLRNAIEKRKCVEKIDFFYVCIKRFFFLDLDNIQLKNVWNSFP